MLPVPSSALSVTFNVGQQRHGLSAREKQQHATLMIAALTACPVTLLNRISEYSAVPGSGVGYCTSMRSWSFRLAAVMQLGPGHGELPKDDGSKVAHTAK